MSKTNRKRTTPAKAQAERVVTSWSPTHAYAAPMVGALAVVEALEALTTEVSALRKALKGVINGQSQARH